jgi:hypothetical protein
MVRRARRLRLLASTAILLAALLPHNSLANEEFAATGGLRLHN